VIERLSLLWRFRGLVRNLTHVHLLVKYRGSVLGFLWSLLNPLMMMAIYSIAFRYIMRIQLDRYTFFLLVGLLPWTFFATASVASTLCVITNGSLLTKVQLPREVFPLSTVSFYFVQFLLAMLVFGPFVLIWKTELLWMNALYLAVVGLFLVFTLGVCLALSALTVLYRDVQHFTEVGVMLFFWLTPIVYNFEMVPAEMKPWFLANPLTLFMNSFHDLLYWDRMPPIPTLVGIVAWTVGAMTMGWAVFRRIEPRMAEEV
jgi:ABC-type polysaccharide/polyol phosphate export permease